jgi:hypothetical protein
MEWHRMDEAKWDWGSKAVGALWDAVEVVAVWVAAPWDPAHPWRWGVALEGKTFPVGPSQKARIWAAWGTAAGELEAMERAEAEALALLEALPKGWARVWGEDPPF